MPKNNINIEELIIRYSGGLIKNGKDAKTAAIILIVVLSIAVGFIFSKATGSNLPLENPHLKLQRNR